MLLEFAYQYSFPSTYKCVVGYVSENSHCLSSVATMNCLFALSLLSSFLLVRARCPIGTVQGVSATDCYLINPTPTMWLKAEESCIRQNGHLTSVAGAIGNAVVRQVIGVSSATEFWLGGSWDTESPRQWTWTDERRFSYTNWASGMLHRFSTSTYEPVVFRL